MSCVCDKLKRFASANLTKFEFNFHDSREMICQRVVDFVDEGHTHRAAASQFRVSLKFVNDMVRLKKATGSFDAKPQGNGGGRGKLSGITAWMRRQIAEKPDLTLDELVDELQVVHGIFRSLCRNAAGPDAAKGRRRNFGQPCQA